MIAKDVISGILLGLAVLIVLGASVGLLVMRDAYQKLHYVTPVALVAPFLVALAILVQVGVYANTGETFLACGVLVIAGPFVSHATVRALRIREKGDWRPEKEPAKVPSGEREQ